MASAIDPADWVANRIVERYGRPGRSAYLVMFRLKEGSDFSGVTPKPDSIEAAWIDAGSGLLPAKVEAALARCETLRAVHTPADAPHRLTSDERRQMMARCILFSVVQS